MSPATTAILARVRAVGAELRADGDKLRWRAPEPLPTDLLADLKARKVEVLADLRAYGALDSYGRRIVEAQSWDDLYAVLADADMDCVDGILTFGDIGTLCDLCRSGSEQLPKHAPEGSETADNPD